MGRTRTGRLRAALAVVLMAALGLALCKGAKAYADQLPVTYLDENGNEQTCTDYTTITSETESMSGWVVVKGEVTIDRRLDFGSETHLILCDGAKLSVKGVDGGIGDTDLTIYAQSTGGDMGRLVTNRQDEEREGINALSVTINGGSIEAVGADVNGATGIYGDDYVVINGGSVLAKGQYGIGGHKVIIRDGSLTAIGVTRCIELYEGEGEAGSLSIAEGMAVVAGRNEADATVVADPGTWEHGEKWARITVPATGDMFRLYNPYSGEHFYTASVEERDGLVELGWKGEGVGWKAPAEGEPVFRLYNMYAGDHHFTTSYFEREMLVRLEWTDEGVGWYTAGEDGVPVYRQYNPYADAGTHNYTTSEDEARQLVGLGWRAEGIGWYGV